MSGLAISRITRSFDVFAFVCGYGSGTFTIIYLKTYLPKTYPGHPWTPPKLLKSKVFGRNGRLERVFPY